ncbi:MULTISPECIES: DUF3000 family protein [Bifidobacterium]|uniref:DUF3000 family protein n=1 Tax=Bifidobacterium TaxID=1678 RepID=UPI001BDDA506|nr:MULTISPECIES: DUF3000 family protein [Bifidobacterium]MBT1162350.1 DUF3000 family protein [Bifidobacterium sp. SO1]MBW3078798.1 DUF3000 family protein [Bifidobacterium simiiventris]
MAEIFAFSSADGQTATTPQRKVASFPRPDGIPDEVWHAVESVRAMRRVRGIRYCEIPVPESAADYGIGVSLACAADDAGRPAAQGWIMVLYRHDIPRTWRSRWRCVAYADLPGNNGTATAARYWSDARGYLKPPSCAGLNGTVTIKQDTAFPPTGDVAGTTETGGHAGNGVGCELRVSWTPLDDREHGLDAGEQIRLWARFIRSMSVTEEEPFR